MTTVMMLLTGQLVHRALNPSKIMFGFRLVGNLYGAANKGKLHVLRPPYLRCNYIRQAKVFDHFKSKFQLIPAVTMNSALQTLNLALQEAVHAFEGSLQPERLESLKTTDSLPNKETWTLASQTVDLADKVVRLLQPPALQLAEGFLCEHRQLSPYRNFYRT